MNRIISRCKNLIGLTRLLAHLRLKNLRLSRSLGFRKTELKKKEAELNLYINKYLSNEQRWAAINYINKKINSTLTTQAVYNFINNELENLLDVDFCAVSIYDDICKKFVMHTKENSGCGNAVEYLTKFLNEGFCLGIESEIDSGVVKQVMNRNLKNGYKAVPLMNKSRMCGVLFVYKKGDLITEELFQVINMVADSIAAALINANLYTKMQISNKRKLEFIAYLSHEFKTPLNAIIGFTTLMMAKVLTPARQAKYFENILNASKHLLSVAESTVDMARAESDKLRLFYQEFSPRAVVSEILFILNDKIEEKEIRLITDFSETKIIADERRFKQLIYNLVHNSIKFNKQGGEIAITTGSDDSKYYFTIKDTGEGIESKEQNKIFEFFSDVEKKKNENIEGSGIGLSLCHKIIDLHKGEITFKSVYGEGTTFTFFLPLEAPASEEFCGQKLS